MPTYELRCASCGHEFEKFFMRMLRAEDRVCPNCGSTNVLVGLGGAVLGPGTRTPSGTTTSACSTSKFG